MCPIVTMWSAWLVVMGHRRIRHMRLWCDIVHSQWKVRRELKIMCGLHRNNISHYIMIEQMSNTKYDSTLPVWRQAEELLGRSTTVIPSMTLPSRRYFHSAGTVEDNALGRLQDMLKDANLPLNWHDISSSESTLIPHRTNASASPWVGDWKLRRLGNVIERMAVVLRPSSSSAGRHTGKVESYFVLLNILIIM